MTRPHVPDFNTPNTSSDGPTIDNSAPIQSNRTVPDGATSWILRSATADERPGRDRDGTRRGDQPVGCRSPRCREITRDQRHDGWHDQRGADAFQKGPADKQHAQVGSRCGGQAPSAVDDQPD